MGEYYYFLGGGKALAFAFGKACICGLRPCFSQAFFNIISYYFLKVKAAPAPFGHAGRHLSRDALAYGIGGGLGGRGGGLWRARAGGHFCPRTRPHMGLTLALPLAHASPRYRISVVAIYHFSELKY